MTAAMTLSNTECLFFIIATKSCNAAGQISAFLQISIINKQQMNPCLTHSNLIEQSINALKFTNFTDLSLCSTIGCVLVVVAAQQDFLGGSCSCCQSLCCFW